MSRKILSSLVIFLFVCSITAFGQPKIGYANTQEILNQLPERSTVQQKLNSFVQDKRQEIQQRSQSFQDSVQQFQDKQSMMTDQQAKQRQKELSQMRNSLQQYQQSIQQQAQQKRAELLEPIYDRMDKAIAAVAKEQNLDFVLNEQTRSGDKIIYYSSKKKLNITEAVRKKMSTMSSKN